jgi:protein subunit release factor B
MSKNADQAGRQPSHRGWNLDHRSQALPHQEQNRFDATQRLITWIQKALEKPKKEKQPTRPDSEGSSGGDKKKMAKLSGFVAMHRKIGSDLLFPSRAGLSQVAE